jgi:hypothetical protein
MFAGPIHRLYSNRADLLTRAADGDAGMAGGIAVAVAAGTGRLISARPQAQDRQEFQLLRGLASELVQQVQAHYSHAISCRRRSAAFSNEFVLRERRDELKEGASKVIREWTGGTLLVVTHGANIMAITGHHANSGEIVVVAPGATQLRAVGRISVPR